MHFFVNHSRNVLTKIHMFDNENFKAKIKTYLKLAKWRSNLQVRSKDHTKTKTHTRKCVILVLTNTSFTTLTAQIPSVLHLATLSGVLACLMRHFRASLASLPLLAQPLGSLPLGTWSPDAVAAHSELLPDSKDRRQWKKLQVRLRVSGGIAVPLKCEARLKRTWPVSTSYQ